MNKKPDKFERMVEKHSRPDDWCIPVVNRDQAVKLLRAQHRAFVRLVTKVSDWQGEQLADNEDACEVILDQLKKWKA